MKKAKGSLFYPYLSSGLGRGCYVKCADGSVKLDFISGIGAHWAHSDVGLTRQVLKAALCDTVMQGNLQQHNRSLLLYERLVRLSGMDVAFLTSSGVMGVENALKLCFHHRPLSSRVLSFSKNFCGRTLAASSITDKPGNRQGLPIVLPVDYVPFYDPDCPEESTQNAVSVLKGYLDRYPDQHACMVFELVQGEGGFNVGTTDFFVALMSCLKEYDVLVYVDETQTFGRTESLFTYHGFALQEYVDVVSIGKLAQVCATLYRKKLKPKPGLISQTYTSSTTAIEASLYILDQLEAGGFLGESGKISVLHRYFVTKFNALKERYLEYLEGPYGKGLMLAFTVFSGDKSKVVAFTHALYEAGLICFVAGNNPCKVRFLPPVGAVTESDIDAALSVVERVLNKWIKEKKC